MKCKTLLLLAIPAIAGWQLQASATTITLGTASTLHCGPETAGVAPKQRPCLPVGMAMR